MTTIISTSTGGQSITTTEPLIVAMSGIISGTTGISFSSGSDPGLAYIFGLVNGTNRGASMNGDDQLVIGATGVVMSSDSTGGDAIYISGGHNKLVISGLIDAPDSGVTLASDSVSDIIEITETGVAKGGSDGNGLGEHYAAVFAIRGNGTSIINNGDIIADMDPATGLSIAIANADVSYIESPYLSDRQSEPGCHQ